MKKRKILYLYIVFALTLGAACAPSALANNSTPQAPPTTAPSSPLQVTTSSPIPQEGATESQVPTSEPAVTEIIPVTSHLMEPAETVPAPTNLIFDVESSGTGVEGRAPYGDSYKLNRFERPFSQDMTYVPDIDIHQFGLSEDTDWYYIFIQLIGNDPNNAPGINYGVEIDSNVDGFGDYVIWSHPPYTVQWDTVNVQVFKDSNLDAAGVSATKSDAVFNGDGYDTLVFDGSTQGNADPDLAWVRISEGQPATIQFAFKKSLTGPAFTFGVVSDMGLKDVSKYDYADYFTEADAGSPVRSNQNYPLGSLYGVDNTCWEAHGIQTTGFEPKVCQPILQPANTNPGDQGSATDGSNLACNPPPDCNGEEPGTGDYDSTTCECR